MSKFFIVFIGVFLFARVEYELKVKKHLNKELLAVKKINNKIYKIYKSEYTFKYPFKDFFVLNNKKIFVGANKEICVCSKDKRTILKGDFKTALLINNILYVATSDKIYKINKNLDIISQEKMEKELETLLYYENKLIPAFKGYPFLSHLGFVIDFDEKLFKYLSINGHIFAIGKNIYNNDYWIRAFINHKFIKINLDILPVKLFYVDGILYVEGVNKINGYKNGKLIFSFKSRNILNVIKNKGKIYFYYPKKIVLLKKYKFYLSCERIKGDVRNIYYIGNLLVLYKRKVEVFDNNLNLLWRRKFKGKVNNVRFINGYIYLIGAKKNQFWIEKLDRKGNVLKDVTFHTFSQGFDIIKTKKGFMAVGYKYFDFLGTFIKSMDVVFLDNHLNFLYDKTYFKDSLAKWVFYFKDKYVVVGKKGKYYILLEFDEDGFLKGIKESIINDGINDAKVFKDKLCLISDSVIYCLINDKFYYKEFDDSVAYDIFLDSENHFIEVHRNYVYFVKNDKKEMLLDYKIWDAVYRNKRYYFIGKSKDKLYICKY